MNDKKNLREVVGLDFRKKIINEDLMVESSSRYCSMYKATNGKWYMELAAREYGDYEDATAYGPFSSMEAVMKHLQGFSNPGGWDEDDSGTRPPPTQSPNGSKVVNPSMGAGSYGAFGGRFGGSRY